MHSFQCIALSLGYSRHDVGSHDRRFLWSATDETLYDHALVVFDPETGELQAVGFEYLKPEWKILDPAVVGDFAFLAKNGECVA